MTEPWAEPPPDVFWIDPDGKVIDVIGHLSGIQGEPEMFGFEASPAGKAEIDAAFTDLFLRGWVRGRHNDGTFSFQVLRPWDVPLANAHAMVLRFEDQAKSVEIDFHEPRYRRMAKTMTAREFVEQRFPVAWGVNPRRSRR